MAVKISLTVFILLGEANFILSAPVSTTHTYLGAEQKQGSIADYRLQNRSPNPVLNQFERENPTARFFHKAFSCEDGDGAKEFFDNGTASYLQHER